MDNSITQKTENAKRYLPHDIKMKENAVKTYLNNGDIEYTCRKYHISRSSLWIWVKNMMKQSKALKKKAINPKQDTKNHIQIYKKITFFIFSIDKICFLVL